MKSKFTLKEESYISELEATGYLYTHPTGAEFYHIKCKDKNRAFAVALDTYPEKDNGVAHILEHAVFSGSEKYPLKEPFVNLMKGSLNTFLNAMTMADRTMYPVASANEKDLLNLVDVYLDAVYHPLIAKDPLIFMQEGVHFERDEEGGVCLNGVVYNEEKGGTASPDSILKYKARQLLFKELYCRHSGGIPREMIGMTGQEILDFHKKFYHPGNSRFYLYGDIEPEAVFHKIEESIEGVEQRPVAPKPYIHCDLEDAQYIDDEYHGQEGMDVAGMTLYMGDGRDMSGTMALQILVTALFMLESSPVRRKLIDSGVCQDMYADLDNSKDVNLLNIVLYDVGVEGCSPCKQRDTEDKAPLDGTAKESMPTAEWVENAVLEAIREADNEELLPLLKAALSSFSFMLKENEYGRMPEGIVHMMQLFTGPRMTEDPFRKLRYQDKLDAVENLIDSGEILDLMRDSMINNPKRVTVMLKAREELLAAQAAEEKEMVEKAWASLSSEEQDRHMKLVEKLMEKQMSQDSPEALATLPRLKREDLGEEPELKDVERLTLPLGDPREENNEKVPLLAYDEFTKNIVYLQFHFPVREITEENLFLLSTLGALVGDMATEKYSPQQLQQELLTKVGGFALYPETYDDKVFLDCEMKFESAKAEEALELVREILLNTRFDDVDMINSKLQSMYSGFQADIVEESMKCAVDQAVGQVRQEVQWGALISGLPYYQRLGEQLERGVEEMPLKAAMLGALDVPNMMVGIIAEESDRKMISEKLSVFLKDLWEEISRAAAGSRATGSSDKAGGVGTAKDSGGFPEASRTGFVIPAPVQFVALAGIHDFGKGNSFSGKHLVLKTLLSTEYLWTQIRLKGGAYGSSFLMGRKDYFAFTSYRDPNCRETLEAFRGAPAYLRELELDEDDIFELILGSLSSYDKPRTALQAGEAAMERAFRGLTAADILRERQELLSTKPEDLATMADMLEEGMKTPIYSVFGDKNKMATEADLFDEITQFYDS